MSNTLRKLVRDLKCVAIIGMEKNAGKTTVLNYLLEGENKKVRAITSIGYDGETTDQVTGTDKPVIYVTKGTLVATAANLLEYCDFTRELLKLTGFYTPMGEVVILRALSDGYAQIAGPSITEHITTLGKMLAEEGAEQLFVDGAASRKSTAAIAISDGCILATGASFSHDLEEVVEQTVHHADLLTLPTIKESGFKFCVNAEENDVHAILNDNESIKLGTALEEEVISKIAETGQTLKALYFAGVVPGGMITKLLAKARNLKGISLIAQDGTKFQLALAQVQRLRARGVKLFTCRDAALKAITINPTSPAGISFNSQKFCELLQSKVSVPVFDVLS